MNARPKSRLLHGLLLLLLGAGVGLACRGLARPPLAELLPTPTALPATATHPRPTQALAPEASPTQPAAPATQAAPTTSPTEATAMYPRAWQALEPLPAGPLRLQQLHMVNERQGWALGTAPEATDWRVLITEDGARTWREVTPPALPPPTTWQTVQALFWNERTAWVMYGYESDEPATAGVWVTHDRGASWQWAPLPWEEPLPWFAPGPLAAVDERRAWALVHLEAGMGHDYALLAATTDGGQHWTRLADPFQAGADSLMTMTTSGLAFAPDGRYGWATKETGPLNGAVLAITTDGGRTWETSVWTPPADPDAFCSTRDPHLWDTGRGVYLAQCQLRDRAALYVLRWEPDAPVAVSPIDAPPAAQAHLTFVTPEEGYLVVIPLAEDGSAAYRSLIWSTQDGGETWTQVLETHWRGSFSWLPGGRGWAVADNGREVRVVMSPDHGHTWRLLPEPRLEENTP